MKLEYARTGAGAERKPVAYRLALSVEQRRYVVVQGSVGGAIVNLLLNGAIGWAITIGLTTFPVWKLIGVAGDLVGTAFGVAFGTCLAAKFSVRWDVARGKLAALALEPLSGAASTPWLSLLPDSVLVRSVVLGVLSVALFALPALAVLWLSGEREMDRVAFIALKAGFSAVEAALVTPLIVIGAMLDVSRRAESRLA